ELFGHPRDEFAEASDVELQNLEIARYWASRPRARKERPTLTADQCAARIRSIVQPIFGDSCEVKISHGLAAYAAAGPRSIAVRTLAIDRAARGADYVDVWRDLASRWGEHKACHLAERVFRGGVLTGGAPFTKDAVYQRGYCRVYNFLRAALDRRDEDLVLA